MYVCEGHLWQWPTATVALGSYVPEDSLMYVCKWAYDQCGSTTGAAEDEGWDFTDLESKGLSKLDWHVASLRGFAAKDGKSLGRYVYSLLVRIRISPI